MQSCLTCHGFSPKKLWTDTFPKGQPGTGCWWSESSRIKDQLERFHWNSDYLPEDPQGPPAITNICKEQSQCEAGLSKTWGGFGQ